MSQIVLAETQWGVILASDTRVTSSVDGGSVPSHFPKIFRIGRCLYGATGHFAVTQMLLNAIVGRVGGSDPSSSSVVDFVRREYSGYCAANRKKMRPGPGGAIRASSLLVIEAVNPPLTVACRYVDRGTFTLEGPEVASRIEVLGPDQNQAAVTEKHVAAGLLRAKDQAGAVAVVRSAIMATSRNDASVGPPIVWFVRDRSLSVSVDADPDARTTIADFASAKADLVQWMVPEVLRDAEPDPVPAADPTPGTSTPPS